MRKLLVFAVMLVLATGLLVSCGGGEEEGKSSSSKKPEKASKAEKTEPTPVETVRLSYRTTIEEQTARVASTTRTSSTPAGSTTGDQVPMEFTISSDGLVDLGGDRSVATMKMGQIGEMEVRQIGKTSYQRLTPEMLAEIQGVKPWVKMDVDAFYREQYGASLSEMETGASTDPTGQLEYLKSVGSVKEIGQEEVRGAPTTHYRAIVDLRKEAKLNGDPDVQKAYEKIREMLGSDKLTMDVWLDGKDRIRRYTTDMPLKMDVPVDPTAPKGATEKVRAQVSMSQDIFDFGVPVNVSPPPPEKTMGYEEFQKQVQQQMQQQAAPTQKS